LKNDVYSRKGEKRSTMYMQKNGKSSEDRETVPLFTSINKSITSVEARLATNICD
jgi:hypothetical protein